jgi:hypothetical protein
MVLTRVSLKPQGVSSISFVNRQDATLLKKAGQANAKKIHINSSRASFLRGKSLLLPDFNTLRRSLGTFGTFGVK